MATITASVGEQQRKKAANPDVKGTVYESIERLSRWLEENDYRGYDSFDGLSARFLRPLTFDSKLLRIVLQQSVRRFPLNLRPILGFQKTSSKGMGFLARGFIRLHQTTGDPLWASKAEFALQWLIDNQNCRATRRVLGQSFRLSIAWLLHSQGIADSSMDIADWACVPGCL